MKDYVFDGTRWALGHFGEVQSSLAEGGRLVIVRDRRSDRRSGLTRLQVTVGLWWADRCSHKITVRRRIRPGDGSIVVEHEDDHLTVCDLDRYA